MSMTPVIPYQVPITGRSLAHDADDTREDAQVRDAPVEAPRSMATEMTSTATA